MPPWPARAIGPFHRKTQLPLPIRAEPGASKSRRLVPNPPNMSGKPIRKKATNPRPKMAKFVDTTWAECLARQNPVSTKAKPACMKITSTAPISTNNMFMLTPRDWVRRLGVEGIGLGERRIGRSQHNGSNHQAAYRCSAQKSLRATMVPHVSSFEAGRAGRQWPCLSVLGCGSTPLAPTTSQGHPTDGPFPGSAAFMTRQHRLSVGFRFSRRSERRSPGPLPSVRNRQENWRNSETSVP